MGFEPKPPTLLDHSYIHVHVLMRDEKEGRKKQAKSNKQQGRAIYMYMYQGSSVGLVNSRCTAVHVHGCAVLLCLVVYLTLLASFFLPSHLSLKHVHVYSCGDNHDDAFINN